MRKRGLIKERGFDALNPLELTIHRLRNSSRLSIDPRSQTFLIFADNGVKDTVELLKSLEEFNDCIGRRVMEGVEAEIREAAHDLEDALDSHVSDQIISQSETESFQLPGDERRPLLFSINLRGIEQDIDSFTRKMTKMEMVLDPWFEDGGGGENKSDVFGLSDQSCASWGTRSWFISWFATKAASIFLGMKEDYVQDLENLLPLEERNDDYTSLLRCDLSRSKPTDRFSKVKNGLISWWINKAASIFVMEKEEEEEKEKDDVSSRTELAPNMVGSTDLFCKIRDGLIQDRDSQLCFIVGMAGVGKTALAKKIFEDPLISSKFECQIFVRMGPEYDLEEIKQAILAQMPDGDQTLTVGDGDLQVKKSCLIVLDDVWDLNPWNTTIFPSVLTENWFLITTRISGIARNVKGIRIYFVPFLNKEESWDLLRRRIFVEKRCPYDLEKAGKKIAENCEGLPLLILTVADLLSKAERTSECWSTIAANNTNSIFTDAYEQISEVLYPSYDYLPQYLQTCFLYMGAFPQNSNVRISKLINLWSVEGLQGSSKKPLQRYVEDCFGELVSNSVALPPEWSTLLFKLKSCTLHSAFWYLSKREAWKERFLHVLNSYTDAMIEDIETPRRLSIYKNAILGLKDVRDVIASMSVVRSLLCTGPYHQYEVPICLGLRLLKVLDALTIRFYEFPIEVLKKVHLRYLALTCNGNLPPSISKLWGLQCLIVHQHQSIKSSTHVSQSYLPVEIWDLEELEYVQIMGRNLPDPPVGTILRNLLILLDVGARTCTKRVLGSIPNLQKLRVQIELMPDTSEPLSFSDDIYHLEKLRSLQYVIMNPELKFEAIAPSPLVSMSFLTKLTLSGFGYPWNYMSKFAELPHLIELKLKYYAFRGEKWEIKEGELQMLRYLSIEDTDLVQWTGVLGLECLTLKHCYKLRQIPMLLSQITQIRLVDCNPSAVTCAKQMATQNCEVYVDSSWLDDRKHS